MGKLIVIDGTDGSGKTTQIKLLSQKLKVKKIPFEVISFPQYGKNKYADLIVDYLAGKFGNLNEVDPYAVAKFYANDRKTARDLVKGWLDSGKLVIANRYISSSKAHLGANLPVEKREEFFRWIDELEYQDNGMPKEDLTILLNVDPKVGQENVSDRLHVDIHEQNLEHLEKARQIFMELSKQNNWVVINCMEDRKMRSPEDINKEINFLLEKKVLSV